MATDATDLTTVDELRTKLMRASFGFTKSGLEGLVRQVAYTCPLCGSKLRRRNSWTSESGRAFALVECTDPDNVGCKHKKKIVDPKPKPRKQRV